jgi:hypothetical protein
LNLALEKDEEAAPGLEGPGRVIKREFPPPTFREPSLIELDVAVNGSGAATLDNFYDRVKWVKIHPCMKNGYRKQNVLFHISCRP